MQPVFVRCRTDQRARTAQDCPATPTSLGGRSIDIIWGTRGQKSVALPAEEIEAAQDHGHLVLLD